MRSTSAATPTGSLRVWAPGRVNLIGEHTDYTGGLVFPMAIHLGTEIVAERISSHVAVSSADQDGRVEFDLPISESAAGAVEPRWGRHVAGVASQIAEPFGFRGTVNSTVPLGSGLSSSAALEVAAAIAMGATGSPTAIARTCQRGSQVATGVPCGIMDQLASAAGIEGHALRIDCSTLEITPVAIPDDVCVVVIHSGQHRELADSAYAARRAQCEAAAAVIGPLRDAGAELADQIDDPVTRARARHVISENARVDQFAEALIHHDRRTAGELLTASHISLRDDFEVSTPILDALVERLVGSPGVFGARLTGAGFGGCVVALCEPGTDPTPDGSRGWVVSAGPGARVLD